MTRQACLIFNPVAGQSDPEQDLETIKMLLAPEIELDVQFTTEEIGADRLAKDAVDRRVESIIVSGGDGTLSSAAAALVETDIPLGIISRGTANAFAAALGLPNKIDEACQVILEGYTRKIDTALCNGQPMVLLAGVGFEAATIEDTSRQAKDRWGSAAYLLSGFSQLRQFEPFAAEIETDDQVIRSDTAGAITVANAAPPTSILAQGPAGIVYDDGQLDVTVIALKHWAGTVGATYHLVQSALQGDAAKREDITHVRTRRLKVKANPPQKVVLDGEMVGKTPIEVECVPGGLTIFIPLTGKEKALQKLADLPNAKVNHSQG